MNTYLFPMCDVKDNIAWVEKILARNLASAEEKLIQLLIEDYEEYDLPDDMSEIKRILSSQGIILGELYDIEEF